MSEIRLTSSLFFSSEANLEQRKKKIPLNFLSFSEEWRQKFFN